MTTYRREMFDQITGFLIVMVVGWPLSWVVAPALDWAIQATIFREHAAPPMIGPALYALLVRGLWTRVELAGGALTVRRDGLLGARWALRDVERARLWSVRGPNRSERWRLADMRAVELTLRGGRTVRVGSAEPERLLEAIREAAPAVSVDPAVETGPESGPLHEPSYRRALFMMEAAAVGGLLQVAVWVAWVELA